MKHLTFIEYLATKAQLKNALNETPFKIATYRVNKYCKLETAESQEPLSIKPNNELIVEWVYEDLDNPIVKCVILISKEGSTNLEITKESAKFMKWLNTNSTIVE